MKPTRAATLIAPIAIAMFGNKQNTRALIVLCRAFEQNVQGMAGRVPYFEVAILSSPQGESHA
jgi:hypothetical protein